MPSERQKRIIELLEQHPEGLVVQVIVERVGGDEKLARETLWRLADRGVVLVDRRRSPGHSNAGSLVQIGPGRGTPVLRRRDASWGPSRVL